MSEGSIKIKDQIKESYEVRTPYLVNIVVFNNRYTAYAAVSNILITVFKKDQQEANEIIRLAETEGKATILKGLPKELAEIKIKQAYLFCQDQNKLIPAFNYNEMSFGIEENKGEK